MLRSVAELPPSIRVGHHVFAIVKDTLADSVNKREWGSFNADLGCIKICHSLPNDVYAVEVFIHELLHALYYTTSLHDLDDHQDEETVVTMLSRGLTGVLIDNPWLLGWLNRWGRQGGQPLGQRLSPLPYELPPVPDEHSASSFEATYAPEAPLS